MKRYLWLAISLIACVICVKFGIEAFQSSSAAKESLRANAAYQQLVTALDGYFDSHGVLPKSLSDLKFKETSNLENLQYTRNDDFRCTISFQGIHGSHIVHPLNYETAAGKTSGQK